MAAEIARVSKNSGFNGNNEPGKIMGKSHFIKIITCRSASDFLKLT